MPNLHDLVFGAFASVLLTGGVLALGKGINDFIRMIGLALLLLLVGVVTLAMYTQTKENGKPIIKRYKLW